MAGTGHSEEHCQAEALKLLGDYATLRVIDFLRREELRFTELQRAIGDVNAVTLTSRLKRLESAGLLERRESTFDRRSVAYRLTPLGEGLLPVLREIRGFTRRNAAAGPRHAAAPAGGVPPGNRTTPEDRDGR